MFCRKEVVFLYQLQDGVCPRSYGMNVALAAGLPKDVSKKNRILKSISKNNIFLNRLLIEPL